MDKTYSYLNNEIFNDKLNLALDEPGFNQKIVGRYNLKGENESSFIFNISHDAENTQSEIDIKAVLHDEAKLKILGTIILNKKSVGAKTNFNVKVLILGSKAKAIVLPKLMIDCKDIESAKHAVVIKRISNDDLYFMASRGISMEKAKKLVEEGFLSN